MNHELEQIALEASKRPPSEHHQNASMNHVTQLAHLPDAAHSTITYQFGAMTLPYRGREPQTTNPYLDRPGHNPNPTLPGHHPPQSSNHNSNPNSAHAGPAIQDVNTSSLATSQPTEQPRQQAQRDGRDRLDRLDHYSPPPRPVKQRKKFTPEYQRFIPRHHGPPTERWNRGWYDHYCPSSAEHSRDGEQKGQVRERRSPDALICNCGPPKGRRYR